MATEAGVSSRHLSFLETGRASPSREMVMRLARVLDVPLRERNALLLSAGFAPVYPQTRLDAPELGAVGNALDAILAQQEPFPALIMDRHWNILRANQAAGRLLRLLLGERVSSLQQNLLHRMFDPEAVRPFIANWSQVAEWLVQRVYRECVGGIKDEQTTRLLRELFRYPGVSESWTATPPQAPSTPIVPVSYVKEEQRFDYFSTVTTLGTPQDITLQEIRIECFFPFNPATDAAARRLAA